MQEEYSQLHNYVYSSEMVEFVSISNAFCLYLEELSGEDGKTFIEQGVKHFSSIYSSFMKVSETEPVISEEAEPTVNEQDWSSIYQKIALQLGAHNHILRPADEDEFDRSDLVTHTVSEDMADVYQELRDFTTIYSRGIEELMNDAAWELRERFTEHWGRKLLRSLMALHELFVKRIDPKESE